MIRPLGIRHLLQVGFNFRYLPSYYLGSTGIQTFCPTCRLLGLIPGLAAVIAETVVPKR